MTKIKRDYIEGKYLKAEHVAKSKTKVATIIGTAKEKSGARGTYYEIDIELDELGKSFIISSQVTNQLVEMFDSDDSKDWLSKQIKLDVETSTNGKDYITVEKFDPKDTEEVKPLEATLENADEMQTEEEKSED